MGRDELVDALLTHPTVRSRGAAKEILNLLLNTITSTVAAGDKVVVTGFGTFEPRPLKERQTRNMHTQELMTVPARVRAGFRPSRVFRDAVDKAHRTH